MVIKMKKTIYTFARIEKKYLLDQDKYNLFLNQISSYVTLDEYGFSKISNIYYDNDNDDLIRWSLDKPKYKDKLRIRSYNKNFEQVFVEIKKKVNGIVYKRRDKLSYQDALLLCEGKAIAKNSQIIKEISYLQRLYKLKPKLYLGYERKSFYSNTDKSLRITIDSNIKYRYDNLDLFNDQGCSLLENGQYLLEIKAKDSYPLWLVSILSQLEIFPISFSKYGKIHENKLFNLKEIR